MSTRCWWRFAAPAACFHARRNSSRHAAVLSIVARASRMQAQGGTDLVHRLSHARSRKSTAQPGKCRSNLSCGSWVPMFFLTLANFWQTLWGPFSAVSTSNFASTSKYSFEFWKLLTRSARCTRFCSSQPSIFQQIFKHFRIFCIFLFRSSLIFCNCSLLLSKTHKVWWKIPGISEI